VSADAAAGREATVARVDFANCLLDLDDGTRVEATVRGRLMGPRKALGNAVVVGDRVTIDEEQDRAVVTAVAPRRNALSRHAAGDKPLEQVVAANLDQVLLVASLVQPPFRAGLADRVFAQAQHAGIPARLVLTKLDLGDAGEARAVLDAYARAGYDGHATSATTGEGHEALRHALHGRRTLCVGHSGVGKSTLLNALVPGLDLLEGRVNAKTGKGRHTTTAAWLLRSGDIEVIDTPGIRSFGLWGIGPRDLEQAYPEFRSHLGACRFSDCRHDREPGCAIRAAVEAGEIAARRHASFLALHAELEGE
jgi:ribosome biogenesis GTPase / thiamine phosphate phosphatase